MQKKAFSLLEMSVVLIVVGILMTGIIKGSALMRSSGLDSARLFTKNSPVPNIEGLVAWYETAAADSFKVSEAYDGAQTTTWYDLSPSSIILQKNALTRTASSALTYKSVGINNIPSLNFSGSSNITLSNFYQGASAHSTIFLVFRPTTSISLTLLDSISSGSTTSIGITSTAVALNAGSAVSTDTVTNSASFALNNNYIVAAYLNDSSSKAYVNNTKTPAGNGTISAGTNSLTGLTLGSNKSGGNNFTGLISEVIIYNRPLQSSDRNDVFKYLANKYKIQVAGF
jgi:prepilin-type N-terminal cleavage/methylation domain-containing protein